MNARAEFGKMESLRLQDELDRKRESSAFDDAVSIEVGLTLG
jgi:hypothetical protein